MFHKIGNYDNQISVGYITIANLGMNSPIELVFFMFIIILLYSYWNLKALNLAHKSYVLYTLLPTGF